MAIYKRLSRRFKRFGASARNRIGRMRYGRTGYKIRRNRGRRYRRSGGAYYPGRVLDQRYSRRSRRRSRAPRDFKNMHILGMSAPIFALIVGVLAYFFVAPFKDLVHNIFKKK